MAVFQCSMMKTVADELQIFPAVHLDHNVRSDFWPAANTPFQLCRPENFPPAAQSEYAPEKPGAHYHENAASYTQPRSAESE